MSPTEAAAFATLVIAMFGSLTLMVRFITNSPRRRSQAEVEKLARLKELGLLDTYRDGKGISDQLADLKGQLAEQEKQIAEMREERDFVRRLLEERKG